MKRRSKHPAFTLAEMLVSMSVSTLLMTGLASAMFIAARSIPDDNSAPMLAGASFQIAEQMAAELSTATSFTLLGAHGVEFQVLDRTSDANTTPETIRYEWSGTAGAGLVRTYNGANTTILPDVHAFGLVYGKHDESTTTTTIVETTGAESIVGYFDGWSGITPNTVELTIDSNDWASQLLTVTAPAGTTKIKFTKARVWMRRDVLTVLGNFTIQLYRPTTVGGYQPQSTPLVTAPAISGIGLPLTPYWATSTFNNMPVTDLSRSDYLLLVKGSSADGVVLSHYQNKFAPANGMTLYWSDNGGTTWFPASFLDRQDMRFYLYASYISNTEQEIVSTVSKLDLVRVSLQPGANAAARVDTDVLTYNQPNVTGL